MDALLTGAVAGLHGPVLHPMNSLLLLVQELKHLLATRLPIFTTLFLFSAVFGDEDDGDYRRWKEKKSTAANLRVTIMSKSFALS